jgi:hypothetical protein
MTRAANLAKLITDANLEGTLDVTGIGTFTDDIIIGDGKTIGSASDVDAITIASNGQLTLTQTLIGTSLDISGDIDVDGTTNLDVVDIDGAVDMASTLTVTGVSILNGGVDIAGDLTVDVDGGDIFFKDSGTEFGRITNSGGMFGLQVATQDQDLIVYMNDGGSTVEALKLDGSDAGNATFNGTVLASNGTNSLPSLSFSGDTNTGLYRPSADNLGFAVGGVARAFMSGTQFSMTGNGRFSGTIIAESGDITISDGNLVVASGHGIDFSAASGSAGGSASALLDDYEEGTWTPALTNSYGSRQGTWGSSLAGTYTKVGRKVTVFVSIVGSGMYFSSERGYQQITGMPFTANHTGMVAPYAGSWGAGNVTHSNAGTVYLSSASMYMHSAASNVDTSGTGHIGITLTYFA